MELPASEIKKMRAWLRIKSRDQTWAYVEKAKKQQYIRIAVKKLSEEDDEFKFLKPSQQLDAIVERAKKIAMDQANDDNMFYPMDAEGRPIDDEGKPDLDAEPAVQPARFGDGTEAEVGESRQIGRMAGTAKPKTFG